MLFKYSKPVHSFYKRILVLIFACWLINPFPNAHAQFEPYLDGPLLALNPAAQDKIILYDVATDVYRDLDFGTGWHFVWDFSPDGCRILFTLSDSAMSMARLYSARIDGRDVRELARYDDPAYSAWGVWEPKWSPDDSRIVFTIIRESQNPDGTNKRETHIAWILPEGGETQFYSRTGREYEPQWSPDGQWLVYMSYEERAAGADIASTAVPTVEPPPGVNLPPPVLLSEADLWVVSANGETKYPLTDFATGSVRAPRWSPDGELVSFIYSPSANNDTFWMIGATQGAVPTALNAEWALILDTTWLPNSTHIIGAARDFQGAAENRLWQIPLVGNADTDATPYLANAAIYHADYPRFSADGRWLAARSAYAIMLADVQAGSARLLDGRVLGNTPPVWSPAGFVGEATCALQ